MPFSKETLEFLQENHFRDSKEWFEAHRKEYLHLVLEPLQELVRALTKTMLGIDDQLITEPRVDKTICRIWRDTRFSKDPSRYRDHMWLIFKRGRMHMTEVPGLYVEITPQGFGYGCGFYHASTAWLNTMRTMILNEEAAFLKAQRAFQAQSVFRMEGDCYVRARFPQQPEELRCWLERRGISFNAESRDFNLLFSEQLAEHLAQDFQKIAPVYQFMLAVSERLQQQEAGNTAEALFGSER